MSNVGHTETLAEINKFFSAIAEKLFGQILFFIYKNHEF